MNDSALKILVVDDDDKARARTIGKLRFPDVQVVGESTLGAAAYTWAEQLDVDIALVSVEEPVARSLRTIEALTVGPKSWPVVAISSLNDRDTMRKAIVAGVRDYLVLPAEPNELRSAVLAVQHAEQARRQASEEGARSGRLGTIVTVFAVKGGVGKSTVATNIAAALAQETRYHVALLDLDLHFGDAAVLLDVAPSSTLADAVTELDPTRPQSIAPFLTPHVSRLKLLAAPPTPQADADLSPQRIGQVLEMLATTHDYVVVDTGAQLDAVSAVALDLSTIVLMLVTPEVPCVRRTKAALAILKESGYTEDKLKLIVNRSGSRAEISTAEIARILKYPVFAEIPDDRAIVRAISAGVPVVMSAPQTRAGKALMQLGRGLAGADEAPKRVRFGWLGRRKPSRDVLPPVPVEPLRSGSLEAAWGPILSAAPAGSPAVGKEPEPAIAPTAADEDPGERRPYVDPVAAAAAALLAGRDDVLLSMSAAALDRAAGDGAAEMAEPKAS